MDNCEEIQSDTYNKILEESVFLFSHTGFNGVSMRDIAMAVGITAPALYHHFPDKETLYRATLEHAVRHRTARIRKSLETSGTAEQRLELLIRAMVSLMGEDEIFRRLVQRVLLDGSEVQHLLLSGDVVEETFRAVVKLLKEIAPDCDAYLLVLSIAGMIIHIFEMRTVRSLFPWGRPEHTDPDYIARQITQLLLQGIGPVLTPE